MAKDFFTDYPYVIHTNRELELMLAGKKPLAWFTEEIIDGVGMTDVLAGQDFKSHVNAGTISAFRKSADYGNIGGKHLKIDHYFYTLPDEEWRVEAYWALVKPSRAGNWCAHLERLQGELLGYTDEQNDYHINQRYLPKMRERRNNKERTCGCEA